MTTRAKKRRQRKRRQATRTTPAPSYPCPPPSDAVVLDHLPPAWTAHVCRALVHANTTVAPAPLCRGDGGVLRCEAIGEVRGIHLCLTARANLHAAHRATAAGETRIAGPGRAVVAIADDQPPNPVIVCHELVHAITGAAEHGAWGKECVDAFAG